MRKKNSNGHFERTFFKRCKNNKKEREGLSKSLKEKNTWIYIERTNTKGKIYSLGKNVLVNIIPSGRLFIHRILSETQPRFLLKLNNFFPKLKNKKF